ncbi:RluA family pseudouridine synthase [Pseudalkalibacillus berkeleyi]|uniref:Pseudouridine synthase n=1 Tax=Pseudalkalibacillus berkeleyi TaxID=1069813 RepID=A0ABS9GWF6_9BACL|nr:RluA family pseudouridine synthase [Pseudalkalibacillus berkeleyi]MCF6137034.1 RluA family pseudouridine synthase [Pseudalkalibacillus berkeleyi]
MEQVYIKVTGLEGRDRLDKVISNEQGDTSRSQVQQWIKEQRVKVNGNIVKANYKCTDGDEIIIEIPEPEPLEVIAESMVLDIIYEDEDLLVVNKPRGMVVHPAPGHMTGTLVNGLMAHCQDLSGINGVLRPGIVHRIDKDTTGLLVVAKNDHAHQHLGQQMKDKSTTRKYEAIVHGVIPHNKGTVDAPIGRDAQDRQKMAVTDKNSKDAVTHFNVLERFNAYTFVECILETGRTHQIRVHMNYIEYPVAGDPKYGPKKTLPISGQALHAKTLGFIHPRTEEEMEFTSDLPEDMTTLLDDLRRNEA